MSALVPSGWNTVRLGDIKADERWAINGGPFGSKLGRKDYRDDGVPVIRGVNLAGDGFFVDSGFKFVSDTKADELRANNAQSGDIVVTQRGTLGQVGIIPELSHYERYVISQSQMKLTLDSNVADSRFVYYSMTDPATVRRIHDMSIVAGVPHINLSMFRNFTLLLPPLDIQRKIAAVLSAYDNLIANNTRRIVILEDMARTIYREWFIEFRYPGHETVPLTESEVGPMPEGWEARPFTGVAEFVNGYAFGPAHWGEVGLPIIKIKELKNGVTNDTPRYNGNDLPAKFHIASGDILFSWSADLNVYIWSGGDALLNQHLFVVNPAEGVTRLFTFHALADAMDDFRIRSGGTTMRHIKRSALKEVSTVVPPHDLLGRLDDVLEPVHALVLSLTRANRRLTVTRDLLLPRLVSGEFDVSDLDIDLGVVA